MVLKTTADISMYPKAMAASGITYGEIIDRLVEHIAAPSGNHAMNLAR
ncbi:hypothetical protein [Agrobacterium fabrum]|nr:hypothetical protein [Agrobacterium fabrum]MDH6298169.1 hypothetical protein [Agrobacterium fabrum]NTB10770.1 hypothetical protein [Agrobacterium fabrum]